MWSIRSWCEPGGGTARSSHLSTVPRSSIAHCGGCGAQRQWLANEIMDDSRGARCTWSNFQQDQAGRAAHQPLYIGQCDTKPRRSPGEHLAIISKETWTAVQTQLALKGSTGGAKVRKSMASFSKACCSARAASAPCRRRTRPRSTDAIATTFARTRRRPAGRIVHRVRTTHS